MGRITQPTEFYTRESVVTDEYGLYIFTDNTDRTSGHNPLPDDCWYTKKFGKGLCYPNKTTAIIRGVDNAFPISTQKHYKYPVILGRWVDSDFDKFKEIIDMEIDHIKKAWTNGCYERLVIPSGGFFNRRISNISEERTPKLYEYLYNKLIELFKFVEAN